MQSSKYFITLFLSIIITSAGVMPAYAQSFHSATNSGRPIISHEMLHPTMQAQDLAHWKAKADTEIDRRVTALQALITKLQSSTKLSATEKATQTTQIQTTITSLTTLKAKIDADTNLPVLKADVQSVIGSYRIFAVYMPKTTMLVAANNILTATDKFSSIAAELAMKIETAHSNGQDVTSLQATVTDMQTKLADAKAQAQSIITAVTPLSPTSFPASTTVLRNARQMLIACMQDIKTAGHDAKIIHEGLKMNKPTKSATPSANPTL